ncbi:hypothetical protein Bbelb_399630 [Branchiostoma belcheri]|nr:hypothetical protein Bbelb_399630 [Branchiostoma belcheri]
MAEDLLSNAVSEARIVGDDFDGKRSATTGTETVQPFVSQAVGSADHHIPDRSQENEHHNGENIQNDAAAENGQTIVTNPDEFGTYAVACICKEHNTGKENSLEEIKFQAPKTVSNTSNDDNNHLARCDLVQNDTGTSTLSENDSNMHAQARDRNPTYMLNTTNPYPMYVKKEVNPNPMYLKNSPKTAFKSNNSEENASKQTGVNHQVDEASLSLRPADDYDSHCLQPYAVTRCQEDKEPVKMLKDNEENPCIQPYAVTHQKHDETANCDVLKPYAVKYEDKDMVVESATDDSVQPYAVKRLEDIEPSLGSVDCDVIQPYAVKYQEDDDCDSDTICATRGAACRNRHTTSIASDEEDITPHSTTSLGDVTCNTASGDTQTRPSSQNPTAASDRISDVTDNPSSSDVLNPPNPMNGRNVQHPAEHG